MKKYLAQIEEVIAAGPYRADWSSLSQHPTPQWYHGGKLGIFIHWIKEECYLLRSCLVDARRMLLFMVHRYSCP